MKINKIYSIKDFLLRYSAMRLNSLLLILPILIQVLICRNIDSRMMKLDNVINVIVIHSWIPFNIGRHDDIW
jgi:hypothetical protein